MIFYKYINPISEKIVKILSNHRSIVSNFTYLSVLQIINLLIPVISYPYLIRILGKETYGMVIFAQAITNYLVYIVNFGFNISATKEISIHRDNKYKLNEIISSVLIIKAILLVISSLLMGLLVYLIPQTHDFKLLFWLSMWLCVYDVIFPVWYFQGIEKMKYIVYVTLTSRIIFLGLIFLFVKSQDDFLFVPILYGIGALFAGVYSIYLIFIKDKIKFSLQHYLVLKYYFIETIPIFFSNIAISLYVNTNKVLAGAFLGMSEVAYYDLAEKITTLIKIPQNIINQALFPKISKEKDLQFIKKVFIGSVILNISILIFTILLSKYIIMVMGGKELLLARTAVIILTITVPFVAMSNIFGLQLLIPFGYGKLFSKATIFSALFYFFQIIFIWLFFDFSIISISIAALNNEIFCACYLYYYCRISKLRFGKDINYNC